MNIMQRIFRKPKKALDEARIYLANSFRDCYGGQFVRTLYLMKDSESGKYNITPQVETTQFDNMESALIWFESAQCEMERQAKDKRIQNVLSLYKCSIDWFYKQWPSDNIRTR